MREEFEKLPDIAKKLRMCEWSYSEKFECYLVEDPCAGFINGAWYAFQEQQKKINAIKAIAEKWENTEYTYNSDSTDTKIEQMRICGREIIQELLK